LQHFTQHAVDAEAHDQAILERFDVNVGRVVLDRLREDGIDQLDDRRLVIALQQVGRFGQILREMREVGVVFHAADHLHGRVGAAFVLQTQQLIERVGIDTPQLQRHAQHTADFRNRGRLRAGAVNHFGDIVLHSLHEHAVTFAEGE
jgi:hypothetical protein